MSQKLPNVYTIDNANLGLLSPAGKDNNGNNFDQLVAPTSNGIVFRNGYECNLTAKKTITSAEVLALFTTPIEIIAAPTAGYAILINKVIIRHAGGVAYAGIASGEDLVLKYTNSSGAEASGQIETTGFLDQTTAQIRSALGVAVAPVDAAAIVLHLLVGNITTGDFDLEVFVDYNIVPTDF